LPPLAAISQSANLDTLTSSVPGMLSYQWYLNSMSIPAANGYKYYPVWRTGLYQVYYVDTNGCANSGSLNITVAGIKEIGVTKDVTVYPNPTEGDVTLEFNLTSPDTYTITLTNVIGQEIYTLKENLKTGTSLKKLNLSGFGKGVYMLTIKGHSSFSVKKIIVD
jgi:hypothetical protein